MTGDVNPAALREFVDRHPDASVPEVLGRFQLNPATYADIVGALLSGEDVDLSADADEHDLIAPPEDGDGPEEIGKSEGGTVRTEPAHENPIDAADVTDAERAAMLREYLEAFVDEFGTVPRLMPLDEEGKAPIIRGRCRLDSSEGRAFLVDGEDAIEQIRNGARGFALYAGKRDHGTENAVFVDHDDPKAFPSPTADPTLEVLSGSGRGPHETYRNAGDVENARVDRNVGEVRAENWYVVTPGSIHPRGGVYHVTEHRPIATLSDEDLDDSMRPATRRRREQDRTAPGPENLDGEGGRPDDEEIATRLEAAFANAHDGDRIKAVYNGNYAAAGFDDRSGAEFWLANRLDSWVGLGNADVVEQVMDRANLQKWPERPDQSYRDSVLSNVGYQDWYYDPDTGGDGAGRLIETCAPPACERIPFDVDERHDALTGERFDAVLEDEHLHIWADEAGAGKTTSAPLAALDRGKDHVVYFDKHEKAREFVTDDALPDTADYYHLKGGEQPVHDCCMDATVAAAGNETPECPVHGHPSEWEHMLPVYDRPSDDETRRAFDALVPEVGVWRALDLLDLDGGAWAEQYDEVGSRSAVAAVHPYATQKTIQEGRLNIIDESYTPHAEDRTLDVEGLTRMANMLDHVADLCPRDDSVAYTAHEVAQFARDVVDVITDGEGGSALADLTPPTVTWSAYETHNDVAGHYVEREEPEEGWHLAEALAACKVEYGETVLARIRDDDWQGEPLSIDPLLAATAAAGLSTDDVMQAVAVPPVLEACPWCHSDADHDNGARCCSSDECDWHEREHTITRKDGKRARAGAWIETDRSDTPCGLLYRALPLPTQLPDPSETLLLDATASPETAALLFGVDVDDIRVSGADPPDIPGMHVTQVHNGQYHANTINRTGTLQARIQRTIDTGADVHRRPLFVVKKDLIPLFDFPENAEVLHYHALRGLNRSDFDAVFLIGAPHPDIEELHRRGELLARGRENVRVGGDEHSTRRDAPNNPPVYRKLFYEDENGAGRAVATKHYTGVVGVLFRQTREDELVQAAHRPRPLLADAVDPVHVYLLTNVPTRLQVDEVVSFEELADPLRALLPVPEGAFELLDAVRDVAASDGSDGFRAEALISRRDDGTLANKVKGYHRLARLSGINVSERTVRNWVDALDSVGLLRPEEYEQRAGVSYTVDIATLQSALSILSDNGGFKVAAVRRFRALVRAANGSLDWLEWARDALNLGGDHCGWDPPPNMVN